MTRRQAFRVCLECDGDKVVVARMIYDEHRGAISYVTATCPVCGGEGYVVIPPRSLRRGMVVARILIAVGLAIALLAIAASRSGQTTVGPTAHGGTTAGAGDTARAAAVSSAGQSGTPRSASSDRRVSPTDVPFPSPAVANVATSEGPTGLTTPMPASIHG